MVILPKVPSAFTRTSSPAFATEPPSLVSVASECAEPLPRYSVPSVAVSASVPPLPALPMARPLALAVTVAPISEESWTTPLAAVTARSPLVALRKPRA